MATALSSQPFPFISTVVMWTGELPPLFADNLFWPISVSIRRPCGLSSCALGITGVLGFWPAEFVFPTLGCTRPPAATGLVHQKGPLNAQRVGEASHPGPQTKLQAFFPSPGLPKDTAPTAPHSKGAACVFAVINPTSVLHKAPALKATGADVLLLAETSAVERAQTLTGNAMRKDGFKVLWGQPVPSHSRDSCPQGTLRGLAAGVAIASRLPAHVACPAMPPAAIATCRLMGGFVRLGALEIRVVVVYGYPLSYPDARERTNELLQQAYDRACQSAVPCIVAGDF